MSPIQGSISIRPGCEDDCTTIITLIKALAIYEGMLDQVQITEQSLRRDAFETNPPLVHTLVAELTPSLASSAGGSSASESENKVIVGYALYYRTYSAWKGKAIHLEDLFVRQEYRQEGIGAKLLKHLALIAKDGKFTGISFECIDWNESAIKFYKKYGAEDVTVKDHWHSYRFVNSAMKKLAPGDS